MFALPSANSVGRAASNALNHVMVTIFVIAILSCELVKAIDDFLAGRPRAPVAEEHTSAVTAAGSAAADALLSVDAKVTTDILARMINSTLEVSASAALESAAFTPGTDTDSTPPTSPPMSIGDSDDDERQQLAVEVCKAQTEVIKSAIDPEDKTTIDEEAPVPAKARRHVLSTTMLPAAVEAISAVAQGKKPVQLRSNLRSANPIPSRPSKTVHFHWSEEELPVPQSVITFCKAEPSYAEWTSPSACLCLEPSEWQRKNAKGKAKAEQIAAQAAFDKDEREAKAEMWRLMSIGAWKPSAMQIEAERREQEAGENKRMNEELVRPRGEKEEEDARAELLNVRSRKDRKSALTIIAQVSAPFAAPTNNAQQLGLGRPPMRTMGGRAALAAPVGNSPMPKMENEFFVGALPARTLSPAPPTTNAQLGEVEAQKKE